MKEKKQKQPKKITYACFDENLSEYLANSINELEKKYNEIYVFSSKLEIKRGATDEEIANYLAKNNGVHFTQDSDFRRVRLLREIINANKIGVVNYSVKNCNEWKTTKIMINAWENIRKIILKENRPFLYKVNRMGRIEPYPD